MDCKRDLKDVKPDAPLPSLMQEIELVFDLKLRRPACVPLQAVYGCGDSNGFLQQTFSCDSWLVFPTPDMRKIRGTREQWQRLAKRKEIL